MIAIEIALRSTQGARPYQEDAARFWAGPGEPAGAHGDGPPAPASAVAVLADGMGGHAGGAVASRLVCEAFLASFTRPTTAGVIERLVVALEAANDAVAEKVASDPMLSGMGSTLVGATVLPEGLYWISVGDSPMYLVRRGEIAMLNEDHSLAPELDRLAAAGRISAAEARNDPRRHMLRSAVTGEDIELVDLPRRPLVLEPGDVVVIASDGLDTIEPEEVARIVTAYTADGCDAIARALIRAVENMREPHQDNTTVVVVRPVFEA